MLPINLAVADFPAMLVGAGPALDKRRRLLAEAGVIQPRVHTETMPTETEIAACRILFIAGLALEQAAPLAALARSHRVLVNVEDCPGLCDFHVPALVRRGDLSIAISTAGKSPGLAALLRRALAARFDERWGNRVAELAALRARLRAAGADGPAVLQASERILTPWLAEVQPGRLRCVSGASQANPAPATKSNPAPR